MDLTINASIAAMLCALREAPSLPTADIRPKHLAHATHGRMVSDMVEAQLVEVIRHRQGSIGQLVAITMTGCRRLAAYQREQDLIATKALRVPPRTYNIFGADYVPPPPPHCRNNGHTHIPARGTHC